MGAARMPTPGECGRPPVEPVIPSREIPGLIHQLWAQLEVLQSAVEALSDRLACVSAPRPAPVECDTSGLKAQTSVGSELAEMISVVDGQSARLREIAAALEL